MNSLLTAKQAAEIFGMSLASLYKMVKLGSIPSYAVGPKSSGVRFDSDELKAALRRPCSAEEQR